MLKYRRRLLRARRIDRPFESRRATLHDAFDSGTIDGLQMPFFPCSTPVRSAAAARISVRRAAEFQYCRASSPGLDRPRSVDLRFYIAMHISEGGGDSVAASTLVCHLVFRVRRACVSSICSRGWVGSTLLSADWVTSVFSPQRSTKNFGSSTEGTSALRLRGVSARATKERSPNMTSYVPGSPAHLSQK